MIVLAIPGRELWSSASGISSGNLRQAALAIEPVHGVAQAGLQSGGRARVQRAGAREREDQPLAGDAEPARGAVEAEQDDLLSEWFKLRLNRRDRARGAWVGRPAWYVMAASRGDLESEYGSDEQHGDQREGNSPHVEHRSFSASAGASARSASPAATRKEVRNALVAARLSWSSRDSSRARAVGA